MKEFQEIQLETLEYIEDQGDVSVDTLSDVFDLSLANARERLKRYARKGWLTVEKSSYDKRYRLSGNGYDRLRYLRETKEGFKKNKRNILSA